MMLISIDSIRTDGGTQPRAVIDFDAVDDYMEAMMEGVKFPPVTVFYDGSDYWLADGFHRVTAAQQADLKEIAADVHQGTREDAQWYSFSANKSNGLRRTNDDKQRAVKAALQHPNGAGKSNSQIARHVGVDEGTVRNWREKLNPSSEIPKIRTVTRNGTTYQQNTSRIGARARAALPEAKVKDKSDPPPVEDAVGRTFKLLEKTILPAEEPYSVDALLSHILLDIMTCPLHLRPDLMRRLQEALLLAEQERATLERVLNNAEVWR